jgi:hypothetical protein
LRFGQRAADSFQNEDGYAISPNRTHDTVIQGKFQPPSLVHFGAVHRFGQALRVRRDRSASHPALVVASESDADRLATRFDA